MQGKIRAVPTLAYGKPMAETDAHRARCLYSQNPQMPNAHPPNALGLSRVLVPSRPDTFAFSGRLPVSMPYFLGLRPPPSQIVSSISTL